MITSHLHAQLIAGCIPASGMHATDAVKVIAAQVLHDHRLHLLTAVEDGHVYYFALPSACVTHSATFDTALAMALPGHPQHQGDGIYVLDAMPGIAVIKRHGELLLLNNDAAAVSKIAFDHGLSTRHIGADTVPWSLVASDDSRRDAIGHLVGRVNKVCRNAIGACVALYILLAVGDAVLDQIDQRKAPATATAALVKRIQYASPLSEQLAQIQKTSATVVRAGGWIDGYVWKQGKGEAFVITLPGWISQDYIEALGPGTVTEQNMPDNLIVARKGDLEKMSKK
jgi:hypothetical protein